MNHSAESMPTIEATEPMPTVTIEESVTPIRYCESCGKSLGRVRNKKYCNGACRIASHRQKQKAKVTERPLQD
jgi:predicted nucleic acid-binding Zn ribbon protein